MVKETVINNMQPPAMPAELRRASASRVVGGSLEPSAPVQTGKALPPVGQGNPGSPGPRLPDPDLPAVVESLNDYLQSVQRDLRFSVDENSGRTIITVMDRESQEVIRQIPPEAAMALADYLRDEGGLESVGVVERA